MRVAIVGVGNLGAVLLRRVVHAGIAPDRILLIQRPGSERLEQAERSGCRVVTELPADIVLDDEWLVILAVKPQDAEVACATVRRALQPGALLLSVMAGISVSQLRDLLNHERIVRAMPNLGAAVGESASVYFCHHGLSSEDRTRIERILGSIGRGWCVADERLVDVATAVAGSGPAYVCFLAEQMEAVAVECGIAPEVAHKLIVQTFRGTAAYLEEADLSFSTLRSKVTSPAGTTMAALSVFEERAVGDAIKDAVRAALKRAVELGR